MAGLCVGPRGACFVCSSLAHLRHPPQRPGSSSATLSPGDRIGSTCIQISLFPCRLFKERLSQVKAKLEDVVSGKAAEYLNPLGVLQNHMQIRIEVAGEPLLAEGPEVPT